MSSTMAAAAGELPAELLGQRVPLADTIASAALRAGQTQRLSDQLMRARFEQHGAGHLGVSAEHGLVVPLVFRNRPYGVLVALDHLDDGEFSAEHQNLLEAFAASAATAVATAQSAADGAPPAASGRRRGRARPLGARAARRDPPGARQPAAHPLGLAAQRRPGGAWRRRSTQALEQLELDITTLRALITELRPAALDQLGLEPALQALIDRTRRAGMEVEAEVVLAYESGDGVRAAHRRPRDRRLPDRPGGAHQRRQARRGDARDRVAWSRTDGQVHVTVRDDGRGFDPSAATAGFGLAGMRERVELLGGELALTSAPVRGRPSPPPCRSHRRDAPTATRHATSAGLRRLSRGRCSVQQAPIARVADKLGARGQPDLLLDVRPVRLDGAHAEEQRRRDLAVGVPQRDQLEHLDLARRKVVRPGIALGRLRGEAGAELRVEIGAPLGGQQDRAHQLAVGGVLEHIADRARRAAPRGRTPDSPASSAPRSASREPRRAAEESPPGSTHRPC